MAREKVAQIEIGYLSSKVQLWATKKPLKNQGVLGGVLT
jgi:hypothetical protein